MKIERRVYIWFSLITFIVLVMDTFIRVIWHKFKYKIPFIDVLGFWVRAFANISLLFLGIFFLPLRVFELLFEQLPEFVPFIYAYFAGVLISHRHSKWREVNVPLFINNSSA